MRHGSLYSLLLVFVLALTTTPCPAGADVRTAWTTFYADGSSFDPRALAVDAAGNSYVASILRGADDDIAITRFDAAGDFVWQRVLSGKNSHDLAVDVVLAADETALFALGRGIPDGQGSAMLVYKIDAVSGVVLWDRFWRSEGSIIEDPQDAAATADGGVVITGGTWRSETRLDFATVRFDADGNHLWHHVYDDGGRMLFNNDQGRRVAVRADGGIVVTGTSEPVSGGSDILTFCFDGATGAVSWQARYSTSANEAARDLVIAPDGDAVVLGTDPFGLDLQWLVVRYDALDGHEVWKRLVDPGFDDSPRAVAVDSAGDIYATGSTDPDGDDGNINNNWIILSLAGDDGAVRWLVELGGEGFNESDYGSELLALGHRLYVAGASATEALTGHDVFNLHALLVELSTADGRVIDGRAIDSTTDPANVISDGFRYLGADAEGRLVAAGRTYDDPDPNAGVLELVQFDTGLFHDGFESGDMLAWSARRGS